MGAKYILPGTSVQQDVDQPTQAAPLLRYYSPRLFGAPPQLTHQCDMRILSSDGTNPGPVGDFYLTRILQGANIANFAIGRARFIGGVNNVSSIVRECYYYGQALAKYDIFDKNGTAVGNKSAASAITQEASKEAYAKAYGEEPAVSTKNPAKGFAQGFAEGISRVGDAMTSDVSESSTEMDFSQHEGLLNNIDSLSAGGGSLLAALRTSLSVQQPFYAFESDWNTYINNVKMMINTAVIMLGLQRACVRIGDNYYPIGMDVNVKPENDVWANYRFITPTNNLGSATAANTDTGDISQYVSFMIDPTGVSENIANSIGPSQIYSSVINSGSSVGAELAFITQATAGSGTDQMISIAKESKQQADDLLKNLSSNGNGRFTTAIASSMARSFTGDHTIYPEVFQGHTASSSVSMTVHLSSDAGDPYSYLINILVPLFFIFGMALPQLSQTNASAYTFPPVIQCNIPGMWGTRLGMVESISINKNPDGKDVSINGYPLKVDVTINIKDLQHVLMTSPMNKPSVFLNNHTMFDYIAQISGVDKYRVNGSMRTIARLALAASAVTNTFNNVSDSLMTDWHSLSNKVFRYESQ